MIRPQQQKPLYMIMITLGSALAAVTQWWIGLASFALAFGLIEALGHGFSRVLRLGKRVK